jgi:hypothetical protein
MTMFRARAAFALAAATLLPGAAAAQQGGWLLGVSGGYASGIGDTFEGPGSATVAVSVLRAVGRNVDLGIELGYHGLGTTTTRLPDLYGPGSTYREDFTQSAWQLSGHARLRPAGSPVRSYVSAGGGAYLLRIRDVIEVRDAGGQIIPQYQFRQTNGQVYPGVHLGLGADRLVSLGRVGLGLHARWHGIISKGIADFFTIGVGLSLD